MGSLHQTAILSSLIILLVGCATKSLQPPTEWDGLEYRPGNETGAVYMRPNVEFKAYRTVMIDPPVVVIDSDWSPHLGSIPVGRGVAPPRQLSSGELQRIKDTIASEFRKILVKEMTAGGYQVLERPSDDTVRVTPVLINVYLDGTSAGRMTLVMELRDAPTGQLLGRFVDEKTGPMGILQFPDSVTENVTFRRAVQAWGRRLRAGVDQMSGQSPKT